MEGGVDADIYGMEKYGQDIQGKIRIIVENLLAFKK